MDTIDTFEIKRIHLLLKTHKYYTEHKLYSSSRVTASAVV